MRHLTVRVLGAFEVTVDGTPATGFAYAKVRALLAYLAVEAHHPHSRAELATLLWPDQSERAARGSLSQALTRLRTALGNSTAERPALMCDVQTVQLDPHCAVEVDVTQFLGLLRTCETHAHRSWRTCSGCSERLREALGLYRGSFLADVHIPDSAVFEEWVSLHREYVLQRALSMLERLVEQAQWRRDYPEALSYARRLVVLEPLLEANQRTYMRLLAANGETGAALAHYRQLTTTLAEELAAAPEDATTELFDRIRHGETARLQPPQPPFVVPVPPAPLVGRHDELQAVCAHLGTTDGHCLTITGTGGIGKTRLAVEAAHALRHAFDDGIFVVELAALNDPALVADAVARVLGVKERPRRSIGEALREHLRATQLLLVLDNFEHVIAAAPLVGELLATCPALTVLVTSRAPLMIRVEQQLVLQPLHEADAVQLFVQRAHAAGAGLAGEAADTTVYGAICRRLDRLPLAIELIAVRARTQSAGELLRQLEQPLEAVAPGPRDAPARHRSLRHAIQWSYDLLDAEHQRVFRHLGVFAGGCGAEAAQAVLCTSAGVLLVLETLVQVSLVQQQVVAGQTRFLLLETIREFALEQLSLCGEAATAHQLHAEYYVDLVARADARLKTSDQRAAAEQIGREHDNALAALAWCSSAGRIDVGLRLCGTLQNYWTAHGLISLGLRWVDRLLAEADESVSPGARVAAMNAGGYMCFYHCDYLHARGRYEQSYLLAQRAEDEAGGAIALNGLGMALWRLGSLSDAQGCLEQSVGLCLQTENRFELARAYNYLGAVYQFAGRAAEARDCYERALPIAREIGHITFAGVVFLNRARLAFETGEYAEARAHYADALAAHRQLGNVRRIADTLVSMGDFHTHLGELQAALELYTEAEQHYLAINGEAYCGPIHAGRGDIALQRGAYKRARSYHQRARVLFRTAGDQQLIARSLGALGAIAVREGQLNEAAGLCAEALTLGRAIGHRAGMIGSLDSGYIELALALGRPAVAARLVGAAETARAALGWPRTPVERSVAERVAATLRTQLGDANFVALSNQGRAMDLEQAAACALDSLSLSSIEQPAPELRIFALGALRVYRGDQLLSSTDWTYAKAREIVLLLLCRPNATREEIGAQLWPEASTEHVRQRFSAALAHARNALGRGNEWIGLDAGRYHFRRTSAVWFDVDAFEAALFEAQLLQRSGQQDERTAALLAEAVALYSGEFAADMYDGEWHIARRERLHHAFLDALLALGRLHAAAGRQEQAIAVLQRAIEADEYHEAAYHELIRAYARLGKRRQALAQYSKLQSALSELQAQPSAETMALIQNLRSSDPL